MSPALLMTEFEWRWNKLIAKQNKNLSDNIVVYIVKLAWKICRWTPTRQMGAHFWTPSLAHSGTTLRSRSQFWILQARKNCVFKINFLLLNVDKLNNLALIK